MSDYLWPHALQYVRLLCPWDSPGKNTGVDCHFLLQCMKWKMKVKSLRRAILLATPWTAAYQAPPSMGFSRQEYWSGVPLPSPVVFPTFFNLRLNLAIRSSWSEPQSAPGLVFADCDFFWLRLCFCWSFDWSQSFSIFGCKEYNQSDFADDHLVMSMCKVFSCVFGRGYLLWPVRSLGNTLLAFALLHSVLQEIGRAHVWTPVTG